MNKLISIEQHLTCGHILATLEIKGRVRTLTILTQNFEVAELHELLDCENVTDLEFDEYESLNFYVKYEGEATSTYVQFNRKHY